MGLFDDLLSPLKDIADMAAEVREDVMGSVTQITEDITSLKDQGQAAISDLTGTVNDSVQSGKDIVGK